MALFQPWLGNFNATDQQKNEYIRALKAALIDTGRAAILTTGSYTGNGSSPQVISLSITTLTPQLVIVSRVSGTQYMGITFTGFENSDGTTFVAPDGTSASILTGRISTLTVGSFSVSSTSGTSGFNVNAASYKYFVFGTVSA